VTPLFIATLVCNIVLLANNILLSMFYTRNLSGFHLSIAFQIIVVALGTLPFAGINLYYIIKSYENDKPLNPFMLAIFIMIIVLNLSTGLFQLLAYFKDNAENDRITEPIRLNVKLEAALIV
jgi:heme/copper-type cytochrome/quinol oxidase subunit 2